MEISHATPWARVANFVKKPPLIFNVTFFELNGSNTSIWIPWSPSDPKKSQCIDWCIQIHQICVIKHWYDIHIKFEVSLHFWPTWPTVRPWYIIYNTQTAAWICIVLWQDRQNWKIKKGYCDQEETPYIFSLVKSNQAFLSTFLRILGGEVFHQIMNSYFLLVFPVRIDYILTYLTDIDIHTPEINVYLFLLMN